MSISKFFPPAIHRNDDSVEVGPRRDKRPFGQNRRGSAPETKTGIMPPKPGWEIDLSELLVKARVEAIERDVSDLKKSINQILNIIEHTKAIPFASPIVTFAPELFKLSTPLNVVLTQVENGYIASFPEANLGSSGETMHEAIENLKDLILTVYREFESMDDDSLGPAILKQKTILFNLIQRSREA